MNKMPIYKVTPEVSMNDEVLYLVRVDGKECSFVRGEDEAKLVIDSMAVAEVSRLSKELVGRKIFRQEEGSCIKVLSQSENFMYTNAPKIRTTIDFVPVGYSFLTKNRLSLQRDVPTAPAVEVESSKKKTLNEMLNECAEEIDIATASEVSEESSDELAFPTITPPPLPPRSRIPTAPRLPTHAQLRSFARQRNLGVVMKYFPDRVVCSVCESHNVEVRITKVGQRKLNDLITHKCRECNNVWDITINRKC